MAIKILGANVSPFVRKTRAFCAEKGIPYTLEQVSPFSPPPNWRELSPLGKIPVLEHDGRYINDSSVICAYLEKIHPQPPLYPSDPYEYARACWIEEFMDGGVVPIAGGSVFRPLALQPVLTGKPPDAATIAAAEKVVEEQLVPLLSYLESQLGTREYFVGNRITIADIAAASPFVNIRHAGYPPDPARFPNLAAFVTRMHARPSFKACIEEERPVFGKRWK
jgi:glutathione S-transferase